MLAAGASSPAEHPLAGFLPAMKLNPRAGSKIKD
jgi:hypothetical protein